MTEMTYSSVTRDVLGTLKKPGRIYFLLLALCMAAVLVGAWCWIRQIREGMGVTGLGNPVGWGTYITSFVFWVGIAHSGTLISAILFLLRARWRTAIYRTSEAVTIFAVMTAGLFPLIHVGRVWKIYYAMPYPNGRNLWPNFRSPLVWDVLAVSTYLTVSAIFFLVGLVPDIAAARDQAEPGLRRKIYSLLSFGWQGTDTQWKHYAAGYLFFAALATPLVISVHSVVSWDFAMSVVPGWHTTIFAPYFVAGAILSGLAMVMTILIPLRKALKLEHIITGYHLDAMAKMLLLVSLIVGYSYGMEFFLSWYTGNPYEGAVFHYRPTGDYAIPFWIMVTCNTVIPLAFFTKFARRNLVVMFIISLFVNVGMWFERFTIIVTSLSRDYLPNAWGLYKPSLTEMGILLGSFGLFFMLFLLFVKNLPSVAVAEVKEALDPPERGKGIPRSGEEAP